MTLLMRTLRVGRIHARLFDLLAVVRSPLRMNQSILVTRRIQRHDEHAERNPRDDRRHANEEVLGASMRVDGTTQLHAFNGSK